MKEEYELVVHGFGSTLLIHCDFSSSFAMYKSHFISLNIYLPFINRC